MGSRTSGGTSAAEHEVGERQVRSRRRARRLAGLALVAVTLGLSSCSKGSPATTASGSASSPSANSGQTSDAKTLGAPALGGQGAGGGTQTSEVSFKVDALGQAPAPQVGSFISTATLTVKVKSVADAKPKVAEVTQSLGGGLFGEQTTFGEQSKSVITLKIAPEKFNQLITELTKLGSLASEEVKTDDVTQQVIDLDARIKAAESSLERTRALLDRAQSLVEISQLEGEVSRRQADLESLRGQKVSLDTKINLSTIVITLVGEGEVAPAVAEKKEEAQKPTELPGFGDGLTGGLKVGKNVGTVLLAMVGAVLPFSPILVLAVVAWRLARRNQRKRLAPTGAATSS
jgi:hypothetical protein